MKKSFFRGVVVLPAIAQSSMLGGSNMSMTDVFNNLLTGPLAGLDGLLNASAYIIGIVLLISAYQKHKHHHHNPHEGSLLTIFVYVILALVMFTIPFAYRILGHNYF